MRLDRKYKGLRKQFGGTPPFMATYSVTIAVITAIIPIKMSGIEVQKDFLSFSLLFLCA